MNSHYTKEEHNRYYEKIKSIYSIYQHRILDPIYEEEYRSLHKQKIVPLDIKIDCGLFTEEIKNYQNSFVQWGELHLNLPRYAATLVGLPDSTTRDKDPASYPNDQWNQLYPQEFYLDSDFKKPTELLNMYSLTPLRVFDGYFLRSNILKWCEGARFYPHLDTVIPAPWLRLWGTTHPENTVIRFWDPDREELSPVENIEAGRIYLIDTSFVHDGLCVKDMTYQFFIAVSNQSKDLIKKLIL